MAENNSTNILAVAAMLLLFVFVMLITMTATTEATEGKAVLPSSTTEEHH